VRCSAAAGVAFDTFRRLAVPCITANVAPDDLASAKEFWQQKTQAVTDEQKAATSRALMRQIDGTLKSSQRSVGTRKSQWPFLDPNQRDLFDRVHPAYRDKQTFAPFSDKCPPIRNEVRSLVGLEEITVDQLPHHVVEDNVLIPAPLWKVTCKEGVTATLLRDGTTKQLLHFNDDLVMLDDVSWEPGPKLLWLNPKQRQPAGNGMHLISLPNFEGIECAEPILMHQVRCSESLRIEYHRQEVTMDMWQKMLSVMGFTKEESDFGDDEEEEEEEELQELEGDKNTLEPHNAQKVMSYGFAGGAHLQVHTKQIGTDVVNSYKTNADMITTDNLEDHTPFWERAVDGKRGRPAVSYRE